MLYTHKPLTHFLESWTAEHFGRHDDPAWLRYLEARQKYHALKTEEQAREHDNQGLLGMASAGSCLRYLAAKRAKLATPAFSGAEHCTFEIGHLCEVVILATLEAAGFEMDTTQTEARLGDTHRSAVDSILRSGPVDLPYPCILSAKTSSWKNASYDRSRKAQSRRGFAALPVGGIFKEKFDWFAQFQVEAAALGIEHGVVVVLVKDRIASWDGDPIFKESGSTAWYSQILTFDRPFATELWKAHRSLVRDFGDMPLQAPARVPIPGEHEGDLRWADLPLPGDDRSWRGPNAEAAGDTWNRCFQCPFNSLCREPELSLEDQLRASLEALEAP